MKYVDVKNRMDFKSFEDASYEKHDKLIEIFEKDIAKLSRKTRDNHKWNLDCFLNFHLVRREGVDFEDSVDSIIDFFSYTLRYKVIGITPAEAKSYGATLRKFYKSMTEHGLFPEKNLQEALDLIKDECSDLVEVLDNEDNSNPYW